MCAVSFPILIPRSGKVLHYYSTFSFDSHSPTQFHPALSYIFQQAKSNIGLFARESDKLWWIYIQNSTGTEHIHKHCLKKKPVINLTLDLHHKKIFENIPVRNSENITTYYGNAGSVFCLLASRSLRKSYIYFFRLLIF